MADGNTGYLGTLLDEYKKSGGATVSTKDKDNKDITGVPIDKLVDFMATQAGSLDKYVHETLKKNDTDTISLADFPNGKATLADKTVIDVRAYFGEKPSIAVADLKQFQTQPIKDLTKKMWAVIDSPDGKGSGGDGILTGEDLNRANTSNKQSILESLKTILGNAANVSTPAAQMAINVLNFGNAIVTNSAIY